MFPAPAGGVNERIAGAILKRAERPMERGLMVSSRPQARPTGGAGAHEPWRGGERSADEWEETPSRARSSLASTPLREPLSSARPLWDFDSAAVPSARSGAASTKSGAATEGSAYGRPGSSRPRFVIDASPSFTPTWQQPKQLASGGALDGDSGEAPADGAYKDDEAEQRNVDRQWYDDDEGGGHGEAFNPFAGDDASYTQREVEVQKRLTRRDGSMMTLAQSKRHNQMHMDHTAWEENRLMTSGVARLREADLVRGSVTASEGAAAPDKVLHACACEHLTRILLFPVHAGSGL
jgi:pre-mRNA-splicing factor ATP-dependent RNA helicase DHX38/PRP16